MYIVEFWAWWAVGGDGTTRRGVVGEGAEEPGRSERAPIACGGGMRRSEKARVSEEAVGRGRKSQEIGNGLRMERPRSPCGVQENLRQVGRAK